MKLKKFAGILLAFFSLVSCQDTKENKPLTKLEEYIMNTDSLESHSKLFEEIADALKDFSAKEIIKFKNNPDSKRRQQVFRTYIWGSHRPHFYYLKLTEYVSNRRAAEAFGKVVEMQAGYVSEEELKKLKNFENLVYFKNGASSTILVENVLVEIELSVDLENKRKIDEKLFTVLKNKKYLKLDIEYDGPAVWTRN